MSLKKTCDKIIARLNHEIKHSKCLIMSYEEEQEEEEDFWSIHRLGKWLLNSVLKSNKFCPQQNTHAHTHTLSIINATLTSYHYRNYNSESKRMITYVMRKMYRHLADLVFLNSVVILLIQLRKPSHAVKEYDMKLVNATMKDALIGAATIGISFGYLAVVLVYLIQHGQNIMVVIAAFFISLGTGRQIVAIALDTVTTSMDDFLSSWASILHLLAKNRATPEWRSIESQAEKIFTYKELEHKLPAKLDGVQPDSPQVYKYLDEHKWELGYQPTITGEDRSCIAFAQHAIKLMMDKLQTYNQLMDVQQKSGGANTVILVAIGTVIWLLS